jgi:hypothetical protein
MNGLILIGMLIAMYSIAMYVSSATEHLPMVRWLFNNSSWKVKLGYIATNLMGFSLVYYLFTTYEWFAILTIVCYIFVNIPFIIMMNEKHHA